ncbi:INO80 complex subunit C-like [Strongylocentrotus purpuratus]|uniref:Vps72/YL1 C-terminal domain-containing protein n=1 Tax=Strongylocentrotus purpuratus TaxID=7668 RepID=A0A7M7T167_STRPU|nr:INO80 complex subunit C-like [Strongylocentrotus purpuratus]
MSATVRTSSRIQARKSRVVSTDKEPAAEGRKRKNSKDDETPAVPPTTPAKKSAVVQQNVTLTSPSPSHSSAEPSTPTTASGKPAHIVAISSPPATTPANATMATRSSQRGAASSVPKEDVPSKAIVSTQPVVASAPPENPPATSNTGGQFKSEPASQASVGPAAQPAAQLAAQVLPPPTHIFKNPNFTLSGRGGASAGKKTRAWKTLKQIITSERVQLHRPVGSTYSSIDAPSSRKPPKKYSDISGLPAKYTDPLTKLRYSTTEEFAQLRMFPQDIVNGLLSLRRANLDVQ